MYNIFNINRKYIKSGFTLIELMIVIAIIAIISALTLFNNAKLNSSILLNNTAYEISLIIRDAQISGLGSKVTNLNGNATTSNQGVYIDPSNPEEIIFFSDKNKDNKYTPGSEENQIYNIENKRAGKILSICTIVADTPCKSSNTSNVPNLNIIFKRPNPEAYFYIGSDTSTPDPVVDYMGSIVVNIGFPDGGECKSIIIYKTGAIQIDKSYCVTK